MYQLVDDLAATFQLDTYTRGRRHTIIQHRRGCSMGPRRRKRGNIELYRRHANVRTNVFQAVFQTLCRLQICKNNAIPGSGIIVTVSVLAKGPMTKLMLPLGQRISRRCNKTPCEIAR